MMDDRIARLRATGELESVRADIQGLTDTLGQLSIWRPAAGLRRTGDDALQMLEQMAERFVALHPETKVLFTSGYPEAVIADHGILEKGLAFVSKPYTPEELVGKIRRLLATQQQAQL